MRIAINALSVQDGGGLTFLRNLLRYLPVVGPDNEYVVLVTEAKADSLGIASGNPPNLRTMICPARGWVARACWEQTVLPRLLQRQGVDILYAPGNQGPVAFPCPFVVFVQNVDPLLGKDNGGPLGFRIKREALRVLMKVSVRKARGVIAVSEYTRHLLVEEFGCKSDKIAVIPYGSPDDVNLCLHKEAEGWVRKQSINALYFLAVSNIKYNKNYDTLVDAFAIVSRKMSQPVNLVIAGRAENEKYFTHLQRRVEQRGISSQVHFLGGVDHETLSALYARARALVFPSRVESFGLPPLEAMAYGVPVAASRLAPVVEVCGDAAIYFDPRNPEEMADAIVRLYADDVLRADLMQRGRARAKQFRWEDTARRTLEILQAAVSAEHPPAQE